MGTAARFPGSTQRGPAN
uniref:Uncharacterized protein n=1 Tax=Arundo donax TaxID=35708 RepID=A0A0A8YBX1_ARUDO